MSTVSGTMSASHIGMPPSEASRRIDSETRRRPGRVLVIDHDPAAARAIARALGEDHIVTIAEGAGDALARIAHGEAFDIVLSGVLLPIVSGIDLHRRLGALAPKEAARIVFMTELRIPPEARVYLERIPNPCVAKPVDIKALRLLIEERLRDERQSAPGSESRIG